MKISKKILIYIGVGAYIILAASMGFVLFGQLKERDAINKELTITRSNLERVNPDKLKDQKKELEDKLALLSIQTDSLKDQLSLQIGNVDASSIVFKTAKASGVEVISLTSPSPTIDILENVECSIVVINATVEGDVRDLVKFITSLNLVMPTGVIQSVDMTILEGIDQNRSTAAVLLEVYNYQGD